ncbi:MAG: hypothetical protein EPO11_08855 [Gammaproteobacteria bacterium]|nr:MAG: hypothetical protein EPO11_08855 [Gammaproteobacteria bacterium]
MQKPLKNKKTIAIVGGGRWGQITLSAVANINLPFNYIIVSNVNFDKVESMLETLSPSLSSFNVVRTLDDLLLHPSVTAGIVVNSARQHFDTANKLITNGIHVLIEKPITMSSDELNLLISNAHTNKVTITPGLSYRFCSYIKNFSTKINEVGIPYNFKLEWFDTKNEVRYQQIKTHDTSITIIQDVMPHIWTILSNVFMRLPINPEHVSESSQDYASIIASIGNTRGQIILDRNSTARKRRLSVAFTSRKNLILDFTSEPGIIINGEETSSGDENWKLNDSPVTQQLRYFFNKIEDANSSNEDLEACRCSVKLTEDSSNLSAHGSLKYFQI